MILLSIVIPCYQRHDLLQKCLASVERAADAVQVVLVDDGSTPSLEEAFRQGCIEGDKYFRQENRGRAAALREGLLQADGEYVMVMDSDDEFIPGAIPKILEDLRNRQDGKGVGFVYECTDFDTGELIAGLGTAPPSATLLALRADHGVRGDLKEVIRRRIVQEELYPDPSQERRVPTSYIWSGVSGHGPVTVRPMPVVRHRYLPGGMTKTIRQLKRDNPYWLYRTYLRAACAQAGVYASRKFRLVNAIKALSVGHAIATEEQLSVLKQRLGAPTYLAARMAAFVIRKVGH